MRHQKVALIGGSGFIGSHLVNALVDLGKNVRIATRRRSNAAHLTLLPVDVIETDIHDPAQLAAFVAEADAVINLVGVLQGRRGEPYGPEFEKAHVELPRKIAAACAAKGVRRLLHMSAIGADSEGPSMYLRSKGDGEKAVRDSGLDWTIFRSSVVFGPEDNLLNQFAFLERMFPVIPLACADAQFQPIFVGDVAKAMVNVLDLDAANRMVYELAGPGVFTLAELVRFAGATIGKHSRIIKLPESLGRLQAMTLELAPGEPLISRDNLDSMKTPNIASGPLAPELGIGEPASIEAIAPLYLTGASNRSRFNSFRATAHR
ncbi:complex I NDUFA9 subunit family protein [Caballeronia sp. LP006]|jgi:NADH dehydrogenase|uniref:complex I NDUFA9 subunit family protein n=1 Tax=unclassified Caballeronia TaxID=2646786 RepID=UPI001FD61F32|nr:MULTISPECIES: complex I NDUFA9 subunit family protein [unclassified Caballeronia]MDR5772820.1 complex I NDUFA9 subunit family protein [Caballeronia sp. LZ002]MDR5829714.1 complex I NDUFA9 subunit family protein [Caballeronia sp. LP006]MDR5848254.1 complex I NDUFA9 subunit family protein [Caballeronia sp. LZ003]